MLVLELRNMPEGHDNIDEVMQEIIGSIYAYWTDPDGHFYVGIEHNVRYPDAIGIQEVHGNRKKRIQRKIESLP